MSTTTKEFNAKHGVLAGTSKDNYLEFLGSNTGNPVTISARGSDTDISIYLYPKGNGTVNLPVNTTASVALTDNTTTDATYYPTFSTSSSGTVQTLGVSSTKLTYNPNSGTLSSTKIAVSGTATITGITYADGGIRVGKTNPDLLGIQISATTVTNASAMTFTNGGGNTYIGLDTSTGNRLIGSGTIGGYQFGIVTESATPIIFGTNNINRLTILANGNVGIGTNNPGYKLEVSGTGYFSSDVTVNGNLTINGTTTTVNSTTITVDDPIITLGGDTAPASDDNKDRGIEFRYHNGTSAKVGFFGYDDSAGKFTFIADATNASEVFSGTEGDVAFGNITAFTANLTTNTASSSTTTGTLVVAGGVGIGGKVYTGGSVNITDTTASTNTSTGALIVSGGVGINGALNATTKSFVIPHPTKKNKTLRYGSLESPYHGVRLTGRDQLKNGKCTVKLPSYIKKLVHEEGINIQLTNIKHGKVLWVEDIDVGKNKFTVCADKSTLIPGQDYEFFWDFTAERADVNRLEVES